jgi:hypothetical protein
MTAADSGPEAAVCATCGKPKGAHTQEGENLYCFARKRCPTWADYRDPSFTQRFQPAPAAPPPAAPRDGQPLCVCGHVHRAGTVNGDISVLPHCFAVSAAGLRCSCSAYQPIAAAPSGAREELTEADVVMLTELMREAHIGQDRLWRVTTALQSLRATLRGTP